MKREITDLQDGKLIYYPNFLETSEANETFKFLLELEEWKQEPIKLFGREIMQPRLTALFGESQKSYTYSGLKMEPHPFPTFMKDLFTACKAVCQVDFNICLANLYRHGQDSMGWHSDDEKELGPQPTIASVSLGEERIFHLKHKLQKGFTYKKRLQHGSLLVMMGTTQEFWKHQLPKTKQQVQPRINLTFRKVY